MNLPIDSDDEQNVTSISWQVITLLQPVVFGQGAYLKEMTEHEMNRIDEIRRTLNKTQEYYSKLDSKLRLLQHQYNQEQRRNHEMSNM